MQATIETVLDDSNTVSIHDMASGKVYRYKEYLIVASCHNGVMVIDTDMKNMVSFYGDTYDIESNLNFDTVEITGLSVNLIVS